MSYPSREEGDKNFFDPEAEKEEEWEEQCVYLIDEDMWEASYKNKYYQMMAHCFPEDCAGKKSCD